MFDLITTDLLFTIGAITSLLVLWVASAAVLPWSEEELRDVEESLDSLPGAFASRFARYSSPVTSTGCTTPLSVPLSK